MTTATRENTGRPLALAEALTLLGNAQLGKAEISAEVAFGPDAVPLITEWVSDEIASPRPSLEGSIHHLSDQEWVIGDPARRERMGRFLEERSKSLEAPNGVGAGSP